MPRWQPDALERLQAAAFDLFDEQGYDRTTVAQITRRAGLTQRSFYNHFADKRELLFGLGGRFQEAVVRGVADGGPAPALDLVVRALQAAGQEVFEPRREAVIRRQAVVDRHPELRERESGKRAALAEAVAAALIRRGVDPGAASLAAGAGMLVQQSAFSSWRRPGERRPLAVLLAESLATLRTAVGADAPHG